MCSAGLLWEADFARAGGSADKGSGASRSERARPPERTRRAPPRPRTRVLVCPDWHMALGDLPGQKALSSRNNRETGIGLKMSQ